LRGELDEFERKGVRLVVIGNGSPMQARFFAEDQKLEGHVFTDPKRVVYRALGMREGLGSALKADVLKNAWRAYRRGFRQSSVQGDPWQQGGVVVVDAAGRVVYEYRSETAGDHPPTAEILRALDQVDRSSATSS